MFKKNPEELLQRGLLKGVVISTNASLSNDHSENTHDT